MTHQMERAIGDAEHRIVVAAKRLCRGQDPEKDMKNLTTAVSHLLELEIQQLQAELRVQNARPRQ